jgi:hypothetical protein
MPGGKIFLFKIRHGDRPPQVMGEMADQELVNQVDGPEDIVDDQQEQRMVIIPTDHQGVDTQDTVDDARVSVVHAPNITKKRPP